MTTDANNEDDVQCGCRDTQRLWAFASKIDRLLEFLLSWKQRDKNAR
jgi:hypothetical protein